MPKDNRDFVYRMWKENRELHPSARDFNPTRAEPVCTVRCGTTEDGEVVLAYGVKGWGVTGPHLGSVSYWRWYSDYREAMLDGLWSMKEECLQKELPRDMSPVDYGILEVEIGQIDEQVITAFVLPVFSGLFGYSEWGWHKDCETAITQMHESQWRWFCAHSQPQILAIGIPEVHSEESVPAIKTIRYDYCLTSEQTLVRYGTVVVSERWGLEPLWTASREQAEAKHAEAVLWLVEVREYQRGEDELETAQSLRINAWSRLYDLRTSQFYRDHFNSFSADLLARVEIAEWQEELDKDASAEQHLQQAEISEAATVELESALHTLYLQHLEPFKRCGAVERLKELLQEVLPDLNCPICGQHLPMDDGWYEDMLVYGHMLCPSCPKSEWERHDLPKLIEMMKESWRYLRDLEEVKWEDKRANPLIRYMVGDKAVLQITYISKGDRHGFIVDRTLLKSEIDEVRVQDLRSKIVKRLRTGEWRDLESQVAYGRMFKLSLTYDQNREQWGCRRNEGGKTVVYAVVKEYRYEEGRIEIQSGITYYCSLQAIPQKAETGTFRLVLVKPVREDFPD